MDAINTNVSTNTEIYALKQSMKVQEKMVGQALESLPQPTESALPSVSGLASEGIGSNLDLKA